MTYYAFIQDDKINGKGECPCTADNLFSFEVTEEVYNSLERYIWNGTDVVLNPNYDEEQAEARQAEFLKEFFNTSLGYIRRSVTMADGSHKDFLSDLLPVISMGVQAGQSVNIITYSMPDFSGPVEDWTQYQTVKAVTPQFIQECFLQLSNDFLGGINED